MDNNLDTTVKNDETRLHYCNCCKLAIFKTDSKTYKDYLKGKYNYCPKCGHQINKKIRRVL